MPVAHMKLWDSRGWCIAVGAKFEDAQSATEARTTCADMSGQSNIIACVPRLKTSRRN